MLNLCVTDERNASQRCLIEMQMLDAQNKKACTFVQAFCFLTYSKNTTLLQLYSFLFLLRLDIARCTHRLQMFLN
jgi:hypothetical protein